MEPPTRDAVNLVGSHKNGTPVLLDTRFFHGQRIGLVIRVRLGVRGVPFFNFV
jgi:hypothetical protein